MDFQGMSNFNPPVYILGQKTFFDIPCVFSKRIYLAVQIAAMENRTWCVFENTRAISKKSFDPIFASDMSIKPLKKWRIHPIRNSCPH